MRIWGRPRILPGAIALLLACATASAQPRLLVFSGQPAGVYRHDAIDYGLTLLKSLAAMGGFAYDTTSNPALFTDANLDKYQAVYMNCNCRHTRLLDQPKREAIQRFIRRGGGWAGSHCAAGLDLDLNWPWYLNLVGAVHRHHTDGSQPGILRVDDRTHVSMSHITANSWNISKEELYFYLNAPAPSWRPNPELAQVKVLLTFQSWGNGQTRPPAGNKADSSHLGAMSWYHEYDGGRSWYTGLGHENWLYKDSLYIKHLLGGLKYVLKADGSTGLAHGRPGLVPHLAPHMDQAVILMGLDGRRHAWTGVLEGRYRLPKGLARGLYLVEKKNRTSKMMD